MQRHDHQLASAQQWDLLSSVVGRPLYDLVRAIQYLRELGDQVQAIEANRAAVQAFETHPYLVEREPHGRCACEHCRLLRQVVYWWEDSLPRLLGKDIACRLNAQLPIDEVHVLGREHVVVLQRVIGDIPGARP